MLRLCDVVRAKFFMGPKQLKQLLAEGGPKPLPAHVAANALADTQRWRTDQAATGGIVPRPGMPASAGTVEAMRAGLTFGEPLPAVAVADDLPADKILTLNLVVPEAWLAEAVDAGSGDADLDNLVLSQLPEVEEEEPAAGAPLASPSSSSASPRGPGTPSPRAGCSCSS